MRTLLDREGASAQAEAAFFLCCTFFSLVHAVSVGVIVGGGEDDSLTEQCTLVDTRSLLRGNLGEKEFKALLFHSGVVVGGWDGG